jgi:hypothetical protein
MTAVYEAQVDGDGVVLRVVVSPHAGWAAEHLGGTWAETADPYAAGETVAYPGPGWGHDAAWPEQFALPWQQPEGAHDAYPSGSVVFHAGRMWTSTTAANVWEPGVSGWRDTPTTGYPMWVQPTGAHDAYALDDIVEHAGGLWRSEYEANVWEPGVFGWVTHVE